MEGIGGGKELGLAEGIDVGISVEMAEVMEIRIGVGRGVGIAVEKKN